MPRVSRSFKHFPDGFDLHLLLTWPRLICSTSAQIVASLQDALQADAALGDMAPSKQGTSLKRELCEDPRPHAASNDPSFASHSLTPVVDTKPGCCGTCASTCNTPLGAPSDHATNSVASRHPWAFSKMFSDRQPTAASFLLRIEFMVNLHACIAQRVLHQPPGHADAVPRPPAVLSRRRSSVPLPCPPVAPRRSRSLWRTQSDEGGRGAVGGGKKKTWLGMRLSSLQLPKKIERLSNQMIGL